MLPIAIILILSATAIVHVDAGNCWNNYKWACIKADGSTSNNVFVGWTEQNDSGYCTYYGFTPGVQDGKTTCFKIWKREHQEGSLGRRWHIFTKKGKDGFKVRRAKIYDQGENGTTLGSNVKDMNEFDRWEPSDNTCPGHIDTEGCVFWQDCNKFKLDYNDGETCYNVRIEDDDVKCMRNRDADACSYLQCALESPDEFCDDDDGFNCKKDSDTSCYNDSQDDTTPTVYIQNGDTLTERA